MLLSDYQDRALSTRAGDLPQKEAIAIWALGLAGESGEVADIVKKHIGHGHPLDNASLEKIAEELGDVLWYVAAMASHLGFDLNEIAALNLEKLQRRYPGGFSADRSINREV